MEFLKPQRNYLKRLSAAFLYSSYSGSDLRQAASLPTICIVTPEEAAAHILQLHRQRIEEELEVFTTQTLARTKRRSKYHAVTIPSSVKHQVSETPSTATAAVMARPRSPQKKNELDHEYLQSQLDEQLATIRQQLSSLSNQRAKMEQKMEDLVNGIKEAREVSAHVPKSIVITSSTPTMIRRAHSMDTRKKNVVKTDSEQSLAKYKSVYFQQQMSTSPPLDEVDSEGWIGHQRFASVSSVSSTASYRRDSDVTSVTDSISSSRRSLRPPSLSEYMDDYLSPTPIPELPESPSTTRSVTPVYLCPSSPRPRHRANSSTLSTPPPPNFSLSASSPSHARMQSQPSPAHSSSLLAQTLISGQAAARPRSGSLSILSSPRLALKASLSNSDLRSRSSASPATARKKSPGSKLKQHKKDQRLSYFRKNSFEDLESSLKGSQGSQASISIDEDDDGCMLKGSRDDLVKLGEGGSEDPQESPTGSVGSTGRSRILRRSSLTGQIEHVTNLRAQVRRNSSFNTSPVPPIETLKHAPLGPQRSLSVCGKNTRHSLTPTALRKVVFLKSKETTV